MTVYKIRDWDKHFENAQSRKVAALQWVPLPVKHDGLGFRRLMRMPGGVELYGAWVLIVQVGAKCPSRGTLADERGPLTPEALELKTGCASSVFEKAFNVLSSNEIGWLLPERYQQAPSAPAPEGKKGMEGMEGKKEESAAPACAGCPPGLRDWIDWWNRLQAESLVPHASESDPPSDAVFDGWKRIQKSKEVRGLLADRARIEAAIRASEFCREGWFRLEKLLGGKNKSGEYVARALLDGAYQNRDPKRDESFHLGDVDL